MEIISNDLGNNKYTKNKLKWRQNSNGEYILHKYTEDITEKSNARKLSTQLTKINNADVKKIIDNTEKFKLDMVVMTEWGLGKILNIDGGVALVKIEGTEIEFPLFNLNTSITIYLCILMRDGTSWAEIKVPFDYFVKDLKIKIARITKCHNSQVILVHNGAKIEKNLNIFDLGVYERDTFMAIIKDPQEYQMIRSKNFKMSNKQCIYNAIRIKVSQDILVTGIGLLKNNLSDLVYQLMIFEEEPNSNMKLIFSQKQIIVKCASNKEEVPIYIHKISNLSIKKDNFYEIHQYLNKVDNNQYIGVKCQVEIADKSTGVDFCFSNCQIPGRENHSNIEEGLIPSIYYCVTSEK